MEKSKRILKRFIIALLSLVLIVLVAFYIYTLDYYHALPIATESLSGVEDIDYKTTKNMIVFLPKDGSKHKGLIFYPGGKVEYLSYIPLMERITSQGYTCILLKMPFNLAVFDQNAASVPINEYKDVSTWYLSGHSLGGAMASIYASKNPDEIKGLILLGAYPAADLSSSNLKMLSIYGSEDKILSRDLFEEKKPFGPKNSIYFQINGGNHAYYGSYGNQKDDGIATLSPSEQQDLTAKKIIEFMND